MNLNVGFPPVMATIPYAVDVPLAQDGGRSALDASDEVARPIHRLAEALFGGIAAAPQGKDAGVMRIGPLKIRTGK
jgi:hypothetical protein